MSACSDQQIDIGGRRLAVRIRGRGPWVLLETGAGSGGIGAAWNGLDERLAEFARVIVYDRAGTGGSDPVSGLPTSGDRVRDLAALLEAVAGTEPVLLVGWSLGGLIAQHFAALHPQRVAGLLLLDPTPVDTFSAAPVWQRCLMSSALPNRLFLGLARSGLLKTAFMQRALTHMLDAQLGPHFDRQQLPVLLDAIADPRLHEITHMETVLLAQSCAEVAAAQLQAAQPRPPLIVLSAGYRGPGATGRALQRVELSHARTAAAMGGELRRLDAVSHYMPFEAQDAIAAALQDLLSMRAALSEGHSAR